MRPVQPSKVQPEVQGSGDTPPQKNTPHGPLFFSHSAASRPAVCAQVPIRQTLVNTTPAAPISDSPHTNRLFGCLRPRASLVRVGTYAASSAPSNPTSIPSPEAPAPLIRRTVRRSCNSRLDGHLRDRSGPAPPSAPPPSQTAQSHRPPLPRPRLASETQQENHPRQTPAPPLPTAREHLIRCMTANYTARIPRATSPLANTSRV